MTDLETTVIGAGVVGLAIARQLRLAGQEVLVVDRGPAVGTETSSRNSEVIHAGIYYKPGSLRARLCVRGKELLYDFTRENGVPANRCGKLIVATREEEMPELHRIAGLAHRNGVTDLRELTAQEAKSLEPDVQCVAALHSPSTGIVDSHALMVALEGHIGENGGEVVLKTTVKDIKPAPGGGYALTIESDGTETLLTTRRLILSAGLGATELGQSIIPQRADYATPRLHPSKGHYFYLSGKAPFRHLIYPAPSGAWLGIHLTLDMAGAARFGPDHVRVPGVDYAFDDEDERREVFYREVSRYWPAVRDFDLSPGYVGVRPKIYPEGAPVADFAIHGEAEHGLPDLVALYGIESPGLTSSLAIAEYVAERLSTD